MDPNSIAALFQIFAEQMQQAGMRSESTQHEQARRGADAAARAPTFLGRVAYPEEMDLRAYKRAPFERQMKETGSY